MLNNNNNNNYNHNKVKKIIKNHQKKIKNNK